MNEEAKSVLYPTERQFALIATILGVIGKFLFVEKNVIRPSVALRAAAEVIAAMRDSGVAAVCDHLDTWQEVSRILLRRAEMVAGSGEDDKRAMRLEPFEWREADIFALFGRLMTIFEGNHKAYVGNRNSNTFGALTPAEALKMIYNQMRALAPPSAWHYGPWKQPGQYARTWQVWPWADWMMSELRSIYEQMELEPGYNLPPGSDPFDPNQPFSTPPLP